MERAEHSNDNMRANIGKGYDGLEYRFLDGQKPVVKPVFNLFRGNVPYTDVYKVASSSW